MSVDPFQINLHLSDFVHNYSIDFGNKLSAFPNQKCFNFNMFYN